MSDDVAPAEGPSDADGVRPSSAAADDPRLPRCPHCGADHPPHLLKCTDTDLALPLEGRVLHGKFRFVRQLGRGGMAAVWAAINTLVERRVAIKLIRPEAGRSEETLARFRAEAKAAGRIGHPNVCEILDFGLGPLGPYIVMERLRGKSLGELIHDEERLEPSLAAGIMRQALAGLEAAHRRGIIHRDLKPENIFVHQPEVGPPVVKIMDFGVSKFTDGTSEVETGHGALLGTPEYMAPEQYRGAARADARTDVWAMGAILYKALTGKTAFGGPSVPGTLLMVTTEEPTPIAELVRGVPPELVAVVERCLRKEPDERYQSAQALGEALAPFDLEGLASLVVVDDRDASEERPTPATISLRSQVPAASEGGGPEDAPSRSGADTLLPSSHDRPVVEDAPAPARQQRRAWLRIAGVTAIGVGVLVVVMRGASEREPEPRTAEVPALASTREPLAADASASSHGETSAGTTGEPAPPSASTSAVVPAHAGSEGSEGGNERGTTGEPSTSDGELVIGDEPTTGIPEGTGDEGDAGDEAADPEGGADDGSTKGNNGGRPFDPAHPPPTPPGTIRVGGYLTLAKPGPTSTHAEASAYCRNLGKHAFVGVKTWTLAGPQGARRLAAYVKRGKYWTTANWNGKAVVLDLPSKHKSSLSVDKRGPRPLCVAKWP